MNMDFQWDQVNNSTLVNGLQPDILHLIHTHQDKDLYICFVYKLAAGDSRYW